MDECDKIIYRFVFGYGGGGGSSAGDYRTGHWDRLPMILQNISGTSINIVQQAFFVKFYAHYSSFGFKSYNISVIFQMNVLSPCILADKTPYKDCIIRSMNLLILGRPDNQKPEICIQYNYVHWILLFALSLTNSRPTHRHQ